MAAAAWICLLLPLASAVAITLAGTAISRRVRRLRLDAATMGAFVAALVAFVDMSGKGAGAPRARRPPAGRGSRPGQYHFGLTLLTDQLSIVMMLIVTGVGSLIVAYSVGYMDGEDEERRYFAYMSLFVFSMLLLVQGGNLLLLLAGWGMVGLSSYLLIGYYQERAVGDRGREEGVRDERVRRRDDGARALPADPAHRAARLRGRVRGSPHGGAVANLIALGLLGGAVAKSAQIPLHTWLPDAMEGPTPVSALIHAATMVTAGVYLIVRCHPLFENALRDRGSRGRARRGDASDGGADRARADRHQARDRVLDDVADRLHVRRRRARRVPERNVPPDDARVLQGAALPRRRDRDPRGRRRAGHPQACRRREADAVHEVGVPRRLARARRHLPVRRVLLEGRDHRGRARPRRGTATSSTPRASRARS